MAKNKTPGDDARAGALKKRSRIKGPGSGSWTKRDDQSGKFMGVTIAEPAGRLDANTVAAIRRAFGGQSAKR